MPVPAEFPSSLPCRIAFIAEAPSDEELIGGRPLIGPSGRLFDKLLRVAGIDRDEHLVTNVFDEKIPDNKLYNWLGTTKEAKEWRKDGYMLPPVERGKWLRPEFSHHLDRLTDEITQAQPNVLVPLGGTALWACKGVSNIMAHRGTVSESSMFRKSYKVVPTVHPSFLFHSWKLFATVVADLMKAERESWFSEIRLPDRKLWVDPSLEDLEKFKGLFLDGSELISIDVETIPTWRHMTCVGFAGDAMNAIAIPFVDRRKVNNCYWGSIEEEVKAIDFVKEMCENDTPKVMQNGPYDAQWLFHCYGIKVRNYLHDTRLMHHALYPELPKALGFLGSRYANVGAWKVMRQRGTEKVDD